MKLIEVQCYGCNGPVLVCRATAEKVWRGTSHMICEGCLDAGVDLTPHADQNS